jgi:hypothetical protein
MTETTARQPAGIPAGGQFAATAHAEPQVSLADPTRTPDAQRELLDALFEKRQEIHRLRSQMDLMTIDAAIGSVRRYFPTATRLHVDRARHGWTGERLDEYAPVSLRDKDGNDLTADEPKWFYRREPGDDNLDPGVSIHLSRLSSGFFHYDHEGVTYDPDTNTYVIDMDHKFYA